MVVYSTDYSYLNDEHNIGWVKKTSGKVRTVKHSIIIHNGFVNNSTSGELMAIYYALLDAISNGYHTVLIRNDSRDVIKMLDSQELRPRNKGTKFILYLIKSGLLEKIKNIKFEWIPRDENKEAHFVARNGEGERIKNK